MKLDIFITVDVGQSLSHLFKRLFPKEETINGKLDAILANQEKIMADLQTEFTALGEQLTRQANEIDTEIQQVLDAVNAGNTSAAVVEDARAKITAVTDQIRASADKLASDNPTPTPA